MSAATVPNPEKTCSSGLQIRESEKRHGAVHMACSSFGTKILHEMAMYVSCRRVARLGQSAQAISAKLTLDSMTPMYDPLQGEGEASGIIW